MNGQDPMNHDTEISTLLPPPVEPRPLPRRDARRAQLLRQIDQPERRSRWRIPAPALAAGALAATVVIVAAGVVVNRDSDPTPPPTSRWTDVTGAATTFRIPEPALTSMADLLGRVDEATAAQRRVDLTDGQVVYRQVFPLGREDDPIDTWTTANASRVLTRQASVTKPTDVYTFTEGDAVQLAIWYPSYRTLRAIENATPQAILDQALRAGTGVAGGPEAVAFAAIQKMLAVGVIPPKVRSTLFHAMALIPGVTFDPTSPAPYQGIPRIVLKTQWTAADVFGGELFADQDHRYGAATPAAELGVQPPGRWVPQPGLGTLQAVGTPKLDDVTLSVPDAYEALRPATTVTFRQGAAELKQRPWPLRYELLDRPVTADVTGDGLADLITVIEVHGTAAGGPPESSYLVVVYVRNASGLVPFGVVRIVAPISGGPSVSVSGGTITVHPNYAGNSRGEPASYRWNGAWFSETTG